MRFEEGLSLREARQRFFAETGYSEAQHKDRKVHLNFYGLRFWIPNTRSRQRAVPIHDLHHILTGYRTDWQGEAEISAWELATGCRGYLAAWVLDGLGLLMGLVIAPRRTLRAFFRGLASSNLYGRQITDSLLDERIGVLRKRLRLST